MPLRCGSGRFRISTAYMGKAACFPSCKHRSFAPLRLRHLVRLCCNVGSGMDGVKATRLIRCLLVLAVLPSPLTAVMAKAAEYNKESGALKDAWPEYYFAPNATEVADEIRASGLVDSVFVWGPSPSRSPPFFSGTEKSVWIYPDYDGLVYQIPKRGLFHFNRVDPGWIDLVGVPYLDATKAIWKEVIGVTVQYGPKGFARTRDYRLDRVFLDLDEHGNVALVPRIG